ncbi:MAG: endonuclease/exonuclease/phosphatase family protein [Kiloniellaceae bacterium]
MEIVTWNIQAGRGVDGALDLDRIARTVRAMGDPDVICMQEVARCMPELDGGAGADHAARIARFFPDHTPVFGAALDRDGGGKRRRQFGNLVLSRPPLVQIFRHLLPQPPHAGIKHMLRQAIEVVVPVEAGALRIVTTHLEYHSEAQRMAQVERLRVLHREVCGNQREPALALDSGPYARAPRPGAAVFCGDFNMAPDDPVYVRLLAPFDDGSPALCDAWRLARPGSPHDPTCGIFDRTQWPQGAHCRDYFFVTSDLADRVAAVKVDAETQASDHQPMRLVLAV